MALTTYEIPLDWVPNDDYINSNQGIHYLAWQIGVDQKRQLGIWLIEAVRSPATDLEGLLPEDYDVGELLDDTARYGYARSVSSADNISQVQDSFLDEVEIVTQAVLDGYR
jgi:hypothetical protein